MSSCSGPNGDQKFLLRDGLRCRRAKQGLAELARRDPALFCAYVLRDDRTGNRIELAPMHVAWHELMGEHKRLVLWAAIEHGKTSQLSIARVLWEIGNDPSLRVLILSNTHAQAVKISRTIASYIEESEALHEVFPNLRRTERASEPWQPLSGQITVRRPTIAKDPTISIAGVHGNFLGARFDLVVVDDVLDFENTRTEAQRKQLIDWLQATVHGRITARGRMWVAGTAFQPSDALHWYAQQFSSDGVQRAFRYPVINDDGSPRWPAAWPLERIEERRKELSPAEFARQMLCQARDDKEARFKTEWVEVAKQRGNGRELARGLADLPKGCRTYTGVDLAVQQHAAADLTVFFTIIVHPNGDREVLEVNAGRWAGPEIVEKIVDVSYRFKSIIVLENVASQEYIAQFTRHMSAVPLRTFTTGRGKASLEFQAETLAAEMANGKWIIPNRGGQVAPEVASWIQELLYYDPREHCGDRLAACLFSRHGATLSTQKVEWKRLSMVR
jgi:hypothetical protein